jgi:hypothetical protein
MRKIVVDGTEWPLVDGLNKLITDKAQMVQDWQGPLVTNPEIAQLPGRTVEEKAAIAKRKLENIRTYTIVLQQWVDTQRARFNWFKKELTSGKLATMTAAQFDGVFGPYKQYVDHVEHNVLWGLKVTLARLDILLRKHGGAGIGEIAIATVILISALVVLWIGTAVVQIYDFNVERQALLARIKAAEEKADVFHSELLRSIQELPAGPRRDVLIERLAYAFGEDIEGAPEPGKPAGGGGGLFWWLVLGAAAVGAGYWYFAEGPGTGTVTRAKRKSAVAVERGKRRAQKFFTKKEVSEEAA